MRTSIFAFIAAAAVVSAGDDKPTRERLFTSTDPVECQNISNKAYWCAYDCGNNWNIWGYPDAQTCTKVECIGSWYQKEVTAHSCYPTCDPKKENCVDKCCSAGKGFEHKVGKPPKEKLPPK